jgi:hypothetical protein
VRLVRRLLYRGYIKALLFIHSFILGVANFLKTAIDEFTHRWENPQQVNKPVRTIVCFFEDTVYHCNFSDFDFT